VSSLFAAAVAMPMTTSSLIPCSGTESGNCHILGHPTTESGKYTTLHCQALKFNDGTDLVFTLLRYGHRVNNICHENASYQSERPPIFVWI
jgi:hypothetical protein